MTTEDCPGTGKHPWGVCEPCNTRRKAQKVKRKRQKAYGTYVPFSGTMTDATEVYEIFNSLHKQGRSKNSIAQHYGIHVNTVIKILRGQKRVTKKLNKKVIGMQNVPLTPKFVPRIGTIRRLQALAIQGFPLRTTFTNAINEYCKGREGFVPKKRLPFPYSPYIRTEYAEAVRVYYEKNCMTPGPLEYVRKRAKVLVQGPQRPGFEWAHPLAWDDIDMDDPQARPIGVRRYTKRRTPRGRR